MTDIGELVAIKKPPAWYRPVVILCVAVAGALSSISIAAMILYLSPVVGALEQAETSRDVLEAQLEAIRTTQAAEQALDDCVTLYEDDVQTGKALSQLALADLFIDAVDRTPAVTEEEKQAAAAENRKLVAKLEEANRPLRAAVAAHKAYVALDPPPGDCPHPRAQETP